MNTEDSSVSQPPVLRRWLGDLSLQRVYANLGKLLGGKALAGIISLIYLAMAARALGPHEFGILTLVHTYTVTVGGIVQMPPWHAVVRFGSLALVQDRRADFLNLLRATIGVELIAGGLSVAAAAALSGVIGPNLGWNETALSFAPVYALAVLASVRAVPSGVLQLFNRFDLIGVHQAVPMAVRLMGAIPVVLLDLGLQGFLVAWLVAALAECVVMWAMGLWELRRRGYLADLAGRPGEVRTAHPGIWRFVITTKLDTTLTDLSTRLTPLAIGWMLGPVGAGLYNVAMRAGVILFQPAQMLGQAAYAELARMTAGHDMKGVRRVALRAGLVAMAVGLLLLALCVAWGASILDVLGGAEFETAYHVMLLIVLGRILQMPTFPLGAGLVAMGSPGQSFRVNLASNLMLFPVLLGLLHLFRLNGAGLHTLLQGGFALVAMTYLFLRQVARNLRAAKTAAAAGTPAPVLGSGVP